MKLQRRLARLEQIWPAPPPPSKGDLARKKRWENVAERWCGLLGKAHKLLNNSEREQVEVALKQILDGFQGPYGNWLINLREGRCRLPEIAPTAMKALLLAWLSPEVDCGMVCCECGLEYPQHKAPLQEWKLFPGKVPFQSPSPWYDLPRLFAACPGCGASDCKVDWPHLIAERSYPWKHLDGFVGNQ
jgi:hypothetical protein